MGPGPANIEHQSILANSPYKLFARQGGLLSIATQEPNWSRSPSHLGPSWSPVGPMAVEVCAGPGSADAEHKANRKKITKSQNKYYKKEVTEDTRQCSLGKNAGFRLGHRTDAGHDLLGRSNQVGKQLSGAILIGGQRPLQAPFIE